MRGLLSYACAAMFLAPSAMADQSEDLLEKLANSVSDLESKIKGFEIGDDRSIGGAIDDLDHIRNILSDLREYEDVIDDLDRLISDYEEDLERANDALNALKAMADQVGAAGFGIEQCEEFERNFSRQLSNFTQTQASKIEQVRDAGGAVSGMARDVVEEAEEIMDSLKSQYDDASNPDLRHRDFSGIAERIVEAADDTLKSELEIASLVEETCAPLVDYEDHPGYKTAIGYFQDLDATLEAFYDRSDAWLHQHENLGPDLCTALNAIKKAYCSRIDPEPNDVDPAIRDYERVVSEAQRDFGNRIDRALQDYERNLAGQGRLLEQESSLAHDYYERLRDRAGLYYRIQSASEFRNMNNMADRLWIQYGIQEHKKIQRLRDCNVTERNAPGNNNGRVDCVDIVDCTVWEIKSDAYPRSDGMDQAGGYTNAINNWMEDEWNDAGSIPAANGSPGSNMRFDRAFLEAAVANGCLDSRGGHFSPGLWTYPKCDDDIDLQCE